MPRPVRRMLILGAGWFFVAIGILGIFLPILQGILFLLVGLILLAKSQPRFRLLKQRIKRRYPKYAGIFEEAEKRAASLMRGDFLKRGRGKPRK